jgi:hypothetical protein
MTLTLKLMRLLRVLPGVSGPRAIGIRLPELSATLGFRLRAETSFGNDGEVGSDVGGIGGGLGEVPTKGW